MTEQRKPTLEEMWAHIGKILIPMDQMPDKASMDDKQLQEFYYNLTAADRTFKDLVQVAIFKKEIVAIENEQS
ncbi:hypothetical protein DYY67_0387 [Candidatus Nitrosotalea sp. TS]|uniref:hypothetical protein n=1 Tax=Candidatus Nitrosotalea sp. TS TaxID=2341020 RepID=UPI0014075234|nr:hypothetical protein [Candidatus Nitrosotalea sp. TS]NHI02690.1 hypothetical protein [Candidatus Nitrosotalea sp. TS]